MRLTYVIFILLISLMTPAQCQQTAEDWCNKGIAFCQQGKYDEALQAFNESIRLDPNYAAAWNNKGNALLNKGVTLLFQYKDDEAIKAYDEVIKSYPQLADAWNDKGKTLSWQGKHDDAIKAFDVAIKINPQLADAWYNKGDALYIEGKYDDAIKAFDEVIKIHYPTYAYPRNYYLDVRFTKDAIEAYDEVIRHNPYYADAWYNKGVSLDCQGKYDEAIKAYDEVIKSYPNSTPAYAYACHSKRRCSLYRGQVR
jgi:tetratricopeptide (TPR) repeat protein